MHFSLVTQIPVQGALRAKQSALIFRRKNGSACDQWDVEETQFGEFGMPDIVDVVLQLQLQLERQRTRLERFRIVVISLCVFGCTFVTQVDVVALIGLFQ